MPIDHLQIYQGPTFQIKVRIRMPHRINISAYRVSNVLLFKRHGLEVQRAKKVLISPLRILIQRLDPFLKGCNEPINVISSIIR